MECETFDRTVGLFGRRNESGSTVTIYDTQVSSEQAIGISKAVVSAAQFVSAVRQ